MDSNQHPMEINNIDDNKNKFPATNASHSLPLMVSRKKMHFKFEVLSVVMHDDSVRLLEIIWQFCV